MAVADRTGLPLAVYTASAAPHEVTLVQKTLAARFTAERPARLIGDKAYDSDPLDAELETLYIEMIAPHKSNRKKANTQDGRKLRRYRRRWKVERTHSWLNRARRLLIRWEKKAVNYLGFLQLQFTIVTLRIAGVLG